MGVSLEQSTGSIVVTADDGLWVGRIRNTQAVVVFDPTLQLPNQPNIYVYSVHRGVLRQFNPAELRSIVQTVEGDDRESAVSAYKLWRTKNGESFLQNEPHRLEDERRRVDAAEERIRQAHRQKLIALGIDPASVKSVAVTPRAHRVTHCYNCKQHLDNKIFLECSACNWIICSCGACGCGYQH